MVDNAQVLMEKMDVYLDSGYQACKFKQFTRVDKALQFPLCTKCIFVLTKNVLFCRITAFLQHSMIN